MRLRILRRRFRVALIGTLCLCLSVDLASACHWFGQRWSQPCYYSSACESSYGYCGGYSECWGGMSYDACGVECGSYSSGCESYSSDCGSCNSSCGCGGESVVHESSSCGCGGEVIVEQGQPMMQAEGSYSTPTDAPEPPEQPTYAREAPSTDRQVNKPVDEEVMPGEEMAPPALAEEEAPVVLPPPAEEPAAPPVVRDPVVEQPPQPAVDQPADNDMFGGDEELFGGNDAAPAMEDAAADNDAAGGDLFGNAAEEATPAEEDMFAQPAAEEASEEAAPMEEAAEEEDLFGGDGGMFGEPAAEEASEEPAAAEDADDFGDDGGLFGSPAPAMDETTEEMTEEPAPTDDAEGGDLFGEENMFDTPPAAEEPAEEEAAPADEPSEDAEEEDPFDLFGLQRQLQQPGGFDSLALRHWVDNTGQYTVDARLLSLVDGHVRLLKANGRTTTVALDRLSNADLEFVNAQAAARASQDIARTAQR